MNARICSLALVGLLAVSAFAGSDQAPAFRLATLDGKTFTNSNLKGKVVVLDFWATWCGPCRQVSKIMQGLQTKYKAKGVQIVCVDVKEQGPSTAAVTKYKASHGYTYPFSVDNGQLDKAMKVETLPVVVVIDRAGNLVYRHDNLPGMEAGVSSAIKKALKG